MSNVKIATLRKLGDKIGRAGVSEMAIEMVGECDCSYKGIMKLCGQLSVIAKVATFDEYWNEKTMGGVYSAEEKCLIELENN
jgi:hypothetical protein